jgi:hypothetical protein
MNFPATLRCAIVQSVNAPPMPRAELKCGYCPAERATFMPSTSRIAAIAVITSGALGAMAASAATQAPQGPPQPAVWQEHHAQFDYFGVASSYTCDSLELKVRQILEYLGAKKGVYVVATGCPRGPESLTRSAFVRVDFSTLVAAPDSGNAADTVAAVWTPTTLIAQKPMFMGDGDCELVDHMRKLLTDNFSWKGKVSYQASCPVETVEMFDYHVQGDLLKASGPPAR